MLIVTAFELGHPVKVVVLVKAGNSPIHCDLLSGMAGVAAIGSTSNLYSATFPQIADQ